MFSQQQVKDIIDQVIGYSKLPGCEVNVQWTEDDFIRFARNGITTSGYRVTQQISITSTTADKRSGNSAVSELTPEAIKAGVKQAEDLALISQPNPEDMPALPAQKYPWRRGPPELPQRRVWLPIYRPATPLWKAR